MPWILPSGKMCSCILCVMGWTWPELGTCLNTFSRCSHTRPGQESPLRLGHTYTSLPTFSPLRQRQALEGGLEAGHWIKASRSFQRQLPWKSWYSHPCYEVIQSDLFLQRHSPGSERTNPCRKEVGRTGMCVCWLGRCPEVTGERAKTKPCWPWKPGPSVPCWRHMDGHGPVQAQPRRVGEFVHVHIRAQLCMVGVSAMGRHRVSLLHVCSHPLLISKKGPQTKQTIYKYKKKNHLKRQRLAKKAQKEMTGGLWNLGKEAWGRSSQNSRKHQWLKKKPLYACITLLK